MQSSAITNPSPPSFSIWLKVDFALSAFISFINILAHSLAINIDEAWPIPVISPRVPAPVIKATLFFNRSVTIILTKA